MSQVGIDLSPVVRAVDEVSSQLATVSRDVDRIDTNVTAVSSKVKATQEELADLKKAFREYMDRAEKVAAVQRAETKIGNLKAELDRLYGHYAVVRRTSVGVLQAFDIGNVTNEVVGHVSEELMIQSPRYWLAPALVGLAAWSRDDKDICEKSIQEAYGRNPAKASLFFALVLRRIQRNDAAVRWLRHYLKSCDANALSREFAVILEASAQGAFGPTGAKLLADQIHEWNDTLRMNQAINDAQVEEWKKAVQSNKQQLVTSDYGDLQTYSPDFNTVKYLIESATALGKTTEQFTQVRDTEVPTGGLIADMLDDLLEQLVTEYDDEELPLRREVAYNEAVIETDGDLAKARVTADKYLRALEETVDAVTIQTRAAISPELLGVSTNTQRVAIGAGQKDFEKGVKAYTKEYRGRYLDSVKLQFGSDHTTYAKHYMFPSFETNTNEDEAAATSRLEETWNRTFASFIEEATFKWSQVMVPIVIAVLVVLIGFWISPGFGFLLLVGAGGGVGYWVYKQQKDAEAEVKRAQEERSKAIEASRTLMLDCRAQFYDLMIEYEILDQDEEGLLTLIETWPTAQATKEQE